MTQRISNSKASWVSKDGEIDPAFLAHGAKQERRVSTELIKPFSTVVPHIHWLANDDDIIAKMIARKIIASPSKENG